MIALVLSYAIAPSLADPDGSRPLVAAVRWIEGAALGTIATSVALIAVASIGFLMLNGRLPLRRGATVIAGCFILFGAPIIANGLIGAGGSGPVQEIAAAPPAPVTPTPVIPAAKPPPTYDPYAGAAVPPR
jgi:type IV secretory pathway VirB2 component (pilin)